MARLDGTTQNDKLIWNDAEPVEIYGYAGDDTLAGDAGNDFIYGGAGDDSLFGDPGNDVLYGGRDNDSMYGASGADQLFGGKGNDYLVSVKDTDTLTGGGGSDTFGLMSDGLAIIPDFDVASDFLELLDDLTGSRFLVARNDSNSVGVYVSSNGGSSFDTTLAILTNFTGNPASVSQKIIGGNVVTTPTPSPTPIPTPTPPTSDNWLDRVNYFRSLANLPPVTNNPAWTQGEIEHSRYVVKNDQFTHFQDHNNPWYTPAGSEAGQNSNVTGWSTTQTRDVDFIDGWMTGPFHALGIINPKLTQVAYGSYREADGGIETGATLDVIRGINSNSSPQYPVMSPASGKTVPLRQYGGNEYPDPLTGFPGYTAPTGLPIYLQLGSGNVTPRVTSHSLTQGNIPIEHGVFDETTYSNPDPSAQQLARGILDSHDAVVMIPRNPLIPGNYTASITSSGQTYTWSFNVA
ncbi:CAP domain-containing protein [Kamptonema sp. UHCC 0994]|uniref:CAP domain-containing protein n=1 Tax=Kamptonema sp. UHCC 0994 TaxID=3031329 RepID=UPI0023B944A5|nr:CAP domain-containing protein [Kamptonema sp. UHCC 0994]MDF0552329.1 CAP domain-containing protein [Kamptonema sp. UHCC 0994]